MPALDPLLVIAGGASLGVVQGISEWLPISSKTQILIVSTFLLGLTFSQAYALGLFLEGGTFLAALLYFRKEVYLVLKALVGKGGREGWLLLKYLLVVTLITGVMGVAIYVSVSSLNLGSAIGAPMIVLGIVLLLDGLLIRMSRSRTSPSKRLEDMGVRDLLVIGLAQGLSALPGVSRSGITVSSMLFLGVKAEDSFRLSFLALIPASLGATGVTLLFSRSEITGAINGLSIGVVAIAIIVSIIVSVVMIRYLLKVASSSRITTLVFALGVIAICSGILTAIFGGS